MIKAKVLHQEAFIWKGTQSPLCKPGADGRAVFPNWETFGGRDKPRSTTPLLNLACASPVPAREVLT